MLGFIKSRLVAPIKNMHLRGKLLLAFFLLIIIPYGIFIAFFSSRVSNAIVNLVKYSARQSFDQSEAFLSYKIGKIMDTMNVILMDKTTVELVAAQPEAMDINRQNKSGIDLSDYLSSFQNEDETYRVSVYVNDGFIFASDNVNIFGISRVENKSLFKEIISRKNKVLWYAGGQVPADNQNNTGDNNNHNTPEASGKKTISAIRAFTDPNDYSRVIAVLKVDILESKVKEILRKASPTKSSVTYLQNSHNGIISSSSGSIKPEWRFDAAASEEYMKNGLYSGTHVLKSGMILVTAIKIPNTDWTMFSIVPYNEILEVSNHIKYEILVLSLLIGALAYFISFLISTSITKRIHLLTGKMKKIKNGEFDIKITSDSSDEIGELIRNFNDMAARISFLIKEQFRLGQQAKNSELMALQAQINPHFLYNTMDLISWTAINNDVPEISTIVRSLSKFYKLSLSKGANIIPVRDEIEHVKLYVEIQNRRFNNKIAFQLDAEEEVYEYTTLKTILQPVVENSIMHGILQKKGRTGKITLKVRHKDHCILFTIQDDGVGVPEDKIGGILSKIDEYASSGYGIKNINERIKLYYGGEYGMSYESQVGVGTTVTIRIPAVKNINKP